MDRSAILNSLISSYQTFSISDARETVEKVLKHSGSNSDILTRADVKREVVTFRFRSGNALLNINDVKPLEIEQNLQVLVYVEQGDTHSIKDARYERLLDLTDQIIDWSIDTVGSAINADVYTLTLLNTGDTLEAEGYLSTTLTFRLIINLQ